MANSKYVRGSCCWRILETNTAPGSNMFDNSSAKTICYQIHGLSFELMAEAFTSKSFVWSLSRSRSQICGIVINAVFATPILRYNEANSHHYPSHETVKYQQAHRTLFLPSSSHIDSSKTMQDFLCFPAQHMSPNIKTRQQ